ncbi:hypothetical protein CYMTET_28992 [Cymbomonas tetramitiformis]|uniref:EGF-like domain-containing protein n=1 Tax=Cymbomonas tetramitiformis TaxID=36881 RepID=A0AAE0FLZ5_9CHLO|nr:hypothetical protein CYMTET_28992 [Cymbomonas tetramitiformis]
MSDLITNETYFAAFNESVISSIAASANVSTSSVIILSLASGSVVTVTQVVWSEVDVAAGNNPDTWATSMLNQSAVAAMFTDCEVLGGLTISSPDTIEVQGEIDFTSPPPPASACLYSSPCFPSVVCTDNLTLPQGFECGECPQGFIGDGVECADVDECTIDNGGCDDATSCNNTLGGRTCGECPPQTVGSGELGCLDLDECPIQNGGCDFLTTCNNLFGGVSCSPCPSGYLGSGEGGCMDVDECGNTTHPPCDDLTSCTNTRGGFTCSACPAGYKGDGRVGCRSATSCEEDNGGCDRLTSCDDSAAGVPVVCGACPAGYGGTGDSACEDWDACATEPCFPGVDCADVPAPGMGFECGPCGEGYIGDGMSCEVDKCATGEWCSALVSCTNTPGGGVVCGSCPAGYRGSGAECVDEDECATSPCHRLTSCSNSPGGYSCSACPEGYRGSGQTRCLLATDCSKDNGGCDERVTCAMVNGSAECGGCPEGYVGDGLAGCSDEDGCFEGACVEGVACIDVAAPGSGFTCGACPAGYMGDGFGPSEVSGRPDATGCYENKCFYNNGGCDNRVVCTTEPAAPGGRVCGACPVGYEDLNGDGTLCVDEDGCAGEPCFPGVACTDVKASSVAELGRTRECGACPGGYEGDGEVCEDVDECALEANGGCWQHPADASVRSQCTNALTSAGTPNGRLCSPCPEGFKGSGETGCTEFTPCPVNNGGCWSAAEGEFDLPVTTTCVAGDGSGGNICGECPGEGFSGSGDVGCVDIDSCADGPCFPGVECTDVRAPALGYECGQCPEGYRGDGEHCELCTIGVKIIDSTIVDGKEKRAGWNQGGRTQILAALYGLNFEDCVNTMGTVFEWAGAASDQSTLALSEAVNMKHTLKLSLMKRDLTVGLSYTLQITAYLRGNTRVSQSSALSFFVASLPLQVVVMGGDVATGDAANITLDASGSFDPDGEAGDINYVWTCAREDGLDDCRTRSGALLPARDLVGPEVLLSLMGLAEGLNYTILCTGTKGARTALATTRLTLFVGSAPVPMLVPKMGKHNPGDKLTLNSSVASDDRGYLQLQWQVVPQDASYGLQLVPGPNGTLDSPATMEALVVRAGVLQPGATYVFWLQASDRIGRSTASLTIVVNTPPQNGTIVVDVLEGVELDTVFTVGAPFWVDEDAPLSYRMLYSVVGCEECPPVVGLMIDYGPLPPPRAMRCTMPQPGLAEHGYAVVVIASVADVFGATSEANLTVTVYPQETTDTGNVLGSTEDLLLNGDVDGVMRGVAAVSSQLNANSADDSEGSDDAAQLRDRALSTLGGSMQMTFMTSNAVDELSKATAAVLANPQELANDTQAAAMDMMNQLVASAFNEDAEATISASGGGTGICASLDSLNQAANLQSGNASAPASAEGSNRTAEVMSTLGTLGAAFLKGTVAGENPSQCAGTSVALKVQRDRADLNTSQMYSPVKAPGGSASGVLFPGSLGQVLGGQGAKDNSTLAPMTLDIRLQASSTDAHLAVNRSDDVAKSAGGVTQVVLISEDGNELTVGGLEEAIAISVALGSEYHGTVKDVEARTGSPFEGKLRCTYWDDALEVYTSAGCESMANPAPSNAGLEWRTYNLSELAPSEVPWVVGNESLLSGCLATYEAVYPEYNGTDIGYAQRRAVLVDWTSQDLFSKAGLPQPEPRVLLPHLSLTSLGGTVPTVLTARGCRGACEGMRIHAASTALDAAEACDEGLAMAMNDVSVDSLAPPKLKTISLDDMLSISAADMLKSALLLALVGGCIGFAIYTASTSVVAHNASRQQMLEDLVLPLGTGRFGYHKIGPAWTWSIFEEERLPGIQRASGRVRGKMQAQKAKSVMGVMKLPLKAAGKADEPRMVPRLSMEHSEVEALEQRFLRRKESANREKSGKFPQVEVLNTLMEEEEEEEGVLVEKKESGAGEVLAMVPSEAYQLEVQEEAKEAVSYSDVENAWRGSDPEECEQPGVLEAPLLGSERAAPAQRVNHLEELLESSTRHLPTAASTPGTSGSGLVSLLASAGCFEARSQPRHAASSISAPAWLRGNEPRTSKEDL